MTCNLCGSHAINYSLHGRDGSFPDVCDVCYWRVRYEDRAAEIVRLRAEVNRLRNHIADLADPAQAAYKRALQAQDK